MSTDHGSKRGVSRRRVLLSSATAITAVAIARLLRLSFRNPLATPTAAAATQPPVALVACGSYAADAVREALNHGLALAPPPDVRGKRVLLKPNFVEYAPDRPVTTHVELIRQTIRAFRDRGAAEIVVAEGPGHNPDTAEVWTRTGLLGIGADENARVVDLNTDDLVRTHMRTFAEGKDFRGRTLEYLFLPKTLLSADVVVSMPKMKTHHWSGVTLSMKNLFGVVPSGMYGWPKNILHMNGITRSIVELASSIPVGYAIVDGIEGMEGDGPIMGTAVASHCLIMGRSAFAVDWIGTSAMGLDPSKVEVLRLASATGLGPLEPPPVVGERLEDARRSFVIPRRFDSLRG